MGGFPGLGGRCGFASRNRGPNRALGYHRYVVPLGSPQPGGWRCAVGTIVGRVCTLLGEGPTFLEALADPERCAARSLAMRRWGRSSFARHHPHILRDPGLVKSWDRDGRSLSTRWRCEAGLQRGCCRATWVQGATYREAFADAQRSLETGSDTAAD